MPKPFIFLYGNCQVTHLARGLAMQPEVRRRFRVRRVQSFDIFGENADPRSVRQMAEFEREAHNAAVIVHQAEAWDRNADHVMSRLPSGCIRIPIFSVALPTLWPFYFKDLAVRKVKWPGFEGHYFPYGDSWLTRQVKAGAEPEDIVRDYLALDVNATTPLDAWRAVNIANLRKKEETAVIRVADYIEAGFESRRSFWAINHPANGVIRVMVGQLLEALGLPDLDPAAGEEFAAQSGFGDMLHQPVHPSVIEHYGLSWIRKGSVYRHWNDSLCFEDLVRRYVEMSRRAHGLAQDAAA
jgi:hypothetical protein